MKDTTILIFGDSVAYGLLDMEYGGWTDRMRKKLQKENKQNYYIYNLSVLGQTTHDILKRFNNECKARMNKFDNFIIIFEIGLKDAQIRKNNKNRTTIIKYREDTIKLIQNAKKYSKNIIFMGLTKVNETKKRYKGYFNAEIKNMIKN